jgi:hypothetical protein
VWIVGGVLAFLAWARVNSSWPFARLAEPAADTRIDA